MAKGKKGKVHDITVRLRRKDGTPSTAAQAKAALWAAHKIAQKGGDVEKEMREWEIKGINWRTVSRRGRERTYNYAPGGRVSISEVIGSMGGILETQGMEGLRVAVVDK